MTGRSRVGYGECEVAGLSDESAPSGPGGGPACSCWSEPNDEAWTVAERPSGHTVSRECAVSQESVDRWRWQWSRRWNGGWVP